MDRASDAPVVASAGTQAEPRTPASWLLSAGRFQTAAPLPVGSDPRSVPRTEPVHIAPLPSSPALGRYAKGLPAAVILLRRNRTDRPLNEGFLLRRLQPSLFSATQLIRLPSKPASPGRGSVALGAGRRSGGLRLTQRSRTRSAPHWPPAKVFSR